MYHADDPLRPPDWRWRSAVTRAASAPGHDGPATDSAIQLAVRFLRQRRYGRTPHPQARTAERVPIMTTVHNLATVEPGLREALEVRLLAGEDRQVIAATCGVDVRVVHLYDALFYDVTDRLAHFDFIRECVVRRPRADDSPGAQRGWAIRLLAWAGGPQIAEALLSGGAPLWPEVGPGGPVDVLQYVSETALRTHKINVGLAQILQRLEPDEVRQLNASFAAIELRRAAPPELDPARRALDALFQSLQISKPFEFDLQAESAKCLNTNVEPRAAEYWKMGRGEPVPELEARIEFYRKAQAEEEAERQGSRGR